jgi:hypothetical protein
VSAQKLAIADLIRPMAADAAAEVVDGVPLVTLPCACTCAVLTLVACRAA